MTASTRWHTPAEAVAWLQGRVTGTLRTDHRLIQPGDGFLAWPGAARDAREFLDQAVQAGAVACLAEGDGADRFQWQPGTTAALALYPRLKHDCGAIASLWHGQPSQHLPVVAVTGTNGKTSVSWWVAQAMQQLGHPFGLVGTLGVGIWPQLTDTGLTSPDPLRLQAGLAAMRQSGAAGCIMEASSIGLQEGRLNATRIQVAAFTNFTQDHLDYHGSMDAYWQAKQSLFGWPGLRSAVVNVDDAHGAELAARLAGQMAQGGTLQRLWSYAVADDAAAWQATPGQTRLQVSDIQFADAGTHFTLHEIDCDTAGAGLRHECAVAVQAPVTGLFNVHNLLAVIGILRAQGVGLHEAAAVCAHLPAVPGRMQRIAVPGRPLVVVDYAHTPDAVSAVLQALRPVAQQRGGVLHCVLGCGGNRDASKRPLMAQAAVSGAGRVCITSDNPRNESPRDIIDQMLAGLTAVQRAAVQVCESRHEAIARTIAQAQPQDVVLLAGKGHENYQEVQGQRLPFSDMEQANAALASSQSPQPSPCLQEEPRA